MEKKQKHKDMRNLIITNKSRHKERGVMTIDAAMAIFFMTAIFYFVLTHALLMRTDIIIHTATTQTAKELGQYGHLVKSINEVSEDKMKAFLEYLSVVKKIKKESVNELEHLTEMLSDRKLESASVFTNSEIFMHQLMDMTKHRNVVQMLAKMLFLQYIPGNGDTQKTIYLKQMGVLGGIDGLHFANTKLTKRKDGWYITVAVSCRLRGLYFHYLDFYHFIRHVIEVKVW